MKKSLPGEFPIDIVASLLEKETQRWKEPIVTRLAKEKRDPFRVLITTILSLRTKDSVTEAASDRLFALAKTPRDMLKLPEDLVARTIYPTGFYKSKARVILDVCRRLLDEYDGRVPDSVEELVKFHGVGRKTANLVVGLGYGKPAICVDTHVHRITNRWGYVSTKTPDETEMALRRILPPKYWIPINDWLVTFGQNMCVPISPWCSKCVLRVYCQRKGVARSR